MLILASKIKECNSIFVRYNIKYYISGKIVWGRDEQGGEGGGGRERNWNKGVKNRKKINKYRNQCLWY